MNEKMNEEQRRRQIELVKFMWGGFYRCPTDGRIVTKLKGDDKVLCGCGTSNPKVPQELTEQTGVHMVRFLEEATAAEYIDQELGKQ